MEKVQLDKSMDKKLSVNVVDTSEQSRSNSQMSVGASTVYQQAVSASNMMGEERTMIPFKRRPLLSSCSMGGVPAVSFGSHPIQVADLT